MLIDKFLKGWPGKHKIAEIITEEDLPAEIVELIEQERQKEKPELTNQKEEAVTATSAAEEKNNQKKKKNNVAQPKEGEVHPIYSEVQRNESITDRIPSNETIEELKARIRPEQTFVFSAIIKILITSEHPEVQQATHFSLDVPLKEKGEGPYRWVRCFIHRKDHSLAIAPLKEGEIYAGEPFFPRLITPDHAATPIPNAVRAEIYKRFLKLKGYTSCPLNERPRLMLRISAMLNDKSYEAIQIRIKENNKAGGSLSKEGFNPSQDTIKSHFKSFVKEAKTFFAVDFTFRKNIAPYWVEMGFDLEPIPDLVT